MEGILLVKGNLIYNNSSKYRTQIRTLSEKLAISGKSLQFLRKRSSCESRSLYVILNRMFQIEVFTAVKLLFICWLKNEKRAKNELTWLQTSVHEKTINPKVKVIFLPIVCCKHSIGESALLLDTVQQNRSSQAFLTSWNALHVTCYMAQPRKQRDLHVQGAHPQRYKESICPVQ